MNRTLDHGPLCNGRRTLRTAQGEGTAPSLMGTVMGAETVRDQTEGWGGGRRPWSVGLRRPVAGSKGRADARCPNIPHYEGPRRWLP